MEYSGHISRKIRRQCHARFPVSVGCANVCRLGYDGKLCRKCRRGKPCKCKQGNVWSALKAREISAGSLLNMVYDLGKYDCDMDRCKIGGANYCAQVAYTV